MFSEPKISTKHLRHQIRSEKIAIECVNNDRHCSFSAREILFRDTIEAIIIFYNRVLNLIVGVESVGPNDRDGNETR